MHRPIQWRVVLGACALAGLLLAGCGGHHPSAARSSKPRTPVSTSVVIVDHPGAQTGTGWVYSARDGLLTTAFHVVNGASEVRVKVGRHPWRRAAVVAASPCEDVALLAVNDTRGLRTMPLASPNGLAVGMPANTAGFTRDSGRRRWRSRHGVVTNVRIALGARTRDVDTPPLDDLLKTTSIVSPGQSGGPVTTSAGRLIGMNFGTLGEGDEARGMSIRLDRLLETIDTFRRGEAPGWLGHGIYFYLRSVHPKPRGVVVTGLAGDLYGDYYGGGILVTAVDGVSVGSTFATWCRTIGALPAGWAKLTIVRLRGGTPETVTIPVNRSHVRE
jgi:S1-C subfamily serine protease